MGCWYMKASMEKNYKREIKRVSSFDKKDVIV